MQMFLREVQFVFQFRSHCQMQLLQCYIVFLCTYSLAVYYVLCESVSIPENNMENDESCIAESEKCAENRIKGKAATMLLVFRNAIHYYCLDLFNCQEGKEMVCHQVRQFPSDYVEPSQRHRLIEQCKKWNITIQYENSSKDKNSKLTNQ